MRTPRLLATSVMLSSLLGLAACGGGGGYGGGGGGGMPVAGVGPSKLFGADSAHMAIGSPANPNPGPGAIPVDPPISGGFYNRLSKNSRHLSPQPAPDFLYWGNGSPE